MTVSGVPGTPGYCYYDPFASYPMSTPETVCISEACAASYIEQEPERTQSFTVSEDHPQTNADAAAQGAVEGATAIFRILTSCALTAGPPDRDAGTDVPEEDGYDYFEDADVHDKDGDGIPDEWEVPPDDGYEDHLEVDADGDTVTDEVGDDGETDDGAVCTPQPPIVETDFTRGTLFQTDNTTIPGSLILDKAWTCEWEVASGLRPDEVAAPCRWTPPTSGTQVLTTDPVTLLPALYMDAPAGAPSQYAMEPAGIRHDIGWVIWAEVRLESNAATGNSDLGCGLEVRDYDGVDGRRFLMDIRSDRIKNVVDSSWEYLMGDTTDGPHIYEVSGITNSFNVDVDGVSTPSGSLTFGCMQDRIYWGNIFGSSNSRAYWYGVKVYKDGTSVPYYPSGTFEGIYDLGSSENNLGTGAYISYTSNPPADTNITFETRSGNPTASGDTCSDPVTWLNPWTPISGFGGIISSSTTSAQCLGVSATLHAPTQLLEFATNFCSY